MQTDPGALTPWPVRLLEVWFRLLFSLCGRSSLTLLRRSGTVLRRGEVWHGAGEGGGGAGKPAAVSGAHLVSAHEPLMVRPSR